MVFLQTMEMECNFKSTQNHVVKRIGFTLTHAYYLTATATQGQTLRAIITIDCARLEKTNDMNDDNWRLNLYVMFSRVTQMSDLLLLRPPPREILERGLPSSIKNQLERFETRMAASVTRAETTAKRVGFDIPA